MWREAACWPVVSEAMGAFCGFDWRQGMMGKGSCSLQPREIEERGAGGPWPLLVFEDQSLLGFLGTESLGNSNEEP